MSLYIYIYIKWSEALFLKKDGDGQIYHAGQRDK